MRMSLSFGFVHLHFAVVLTFPDFGSRHLSLQDATPEPTPVQRPRAGSIQQQQQQQNDRVLKRITMPKKIDW